MNQPSSASALPRDILIRLDQEDSATPRAVNELVQRDQYRELRKQIVAHLEMLKAAGLRPEGEYPSASGWTQFVDGTRGAGKSTFLSSVKSALGADEEVRSQMAFIALIDPSRIEHSEIILLVILQHLRKRVEKAFTNKRGLEDDELCQEWRQAFKGVAGGLSLFAEGYHPLRDLDPDLFLDWGLERTSDSTSLRQKLQNLMATACRILGVRALMFAFDDADTDATHGIKLLECIRKYLDFPLVMVLVTGDLELYSLLIRQHFAQTVAGRREAALELQRSSAKLDRSTQYLRMIDHLEEQYLLKLFPIHRRTQLQPLWNVMVKANCLATHPNWEESPRLVEDVMHEITRRGLRVKKDSHVKIYSDFLLKQPLRSTLQVLAYCAPHLSGSSSATPESTSWSAGLTSALSRALQGLALTSFYKFSVDTDALAARELYELEQAVFELSLHDGDIDTAPYLRPMSADPDIKACFSALAAQVPNFCAGQPGTALRYLLRGPGSVSLYSLVRDPVHQFKSYMGIGRREDSLDWARHATAVIALPYHTSPKARVVLPGVVGLNRRGRTSEHKVHIAIQRAINNTATRYLPVFALGIVDVSSPSGMRTYGSIFTLVGLIEKLLSAHSEKESRDILRNAYPSLTVSAPSWLSVSAGSTDDEEDAGDAGQSRNVHELPMEEQLLGSIQAWQQSAAQLAKEVSPSAIFLGKVWTRLFFSLQNAADDLKPRANFSEVMEIFALCTINAFLVEEAEHHLPVSPGGTADLPIDRNNPRTSASAFAKKLKTMKLQRQDLPLTAIIATCPLILGLLHEDNGYAEALNGLFPKDTDAGAIQALLCPKEVANVMAKVSVAGKSRTSDKTSKE